MLGMQNPPQWLQRPSRHLSALRRFPTLQDACMEAMVARQQQSLAPLETRGLPLLERLEGEHSYWKHVVRVSPLGVESWCPVAFASGPQRTGAGPSGLAWSHDAAFAGQSSWCMGRAALWVAGEGTLGRFALGDADWSCQELRGAAVPEAGDNLLETAEGQLLGTAAGTLVRVDPESGAVSDTGIVVAARRRFGYLASPGGTLHRQLFHWGPEAAGQRHALCMEALDLEAGRSVLLEGSLSVCARGAAAAGVPGRWVLMAVGGADTAVDEWSESIRSQQLFDPRVGRWQTFGEPRATPCLPGSCAAVDDSLLVLLHRSLWRLDLRTGRWDPEVAVFARGPRNTFSGLL